MIHRVRRFVPRAQLAQVGGLDGRRHCFILQKPQRPLESRMGCRFSRIDHRLTTRMNHSAGSLGCEPATRPCRSFATGVVRRLQGTRRTALSCRTVGRCSDPIRGTNLARSTRHAAHLLLVGPPWFKRASAPRSCAGATRPLPRPLSAQAGSGDFRRADRSR